MDFSEAVDLSRWCVPTRSIQQTSGYQQRQSGFGATMRAIGASRGRAHKINRRKRRRGNEDDKVESLRVDWFEQTRDCYVYLGSVSGPGFKCDPSSPVLQRQRHLTNRSTTESLACLCLCRQRHGIMLSFSNVAIEVKRKLCELTPAVSLLQKHTSSVPGSLLSYVAITNPD